MRQEPTPAELVEVRESGGDALGEFPGGGAAQEVHLEESLLRVNETDGVGGVVKRRGPDNGDADGVALDRRGSGEAGDGCFAGLAGQLGLHGVPAFIFHEGDNPAAARAFQQIAKLTNGAYCSFDSASAQQLRDLLSAVAVYAAGGRTALEDYGKRTGGAALRLTSQVK